MDIREFAKRLGVSTTTVSHALNGKRPVKAATKQLILEKMNEWGYVPNTNARRLVSSKTNLIAFFSDSGDTLADPYQLEVTRNFCRLLRERGYDLLLDLCHTGENDRYASLRNRVMAHSIDGSIIIAGSLTEKDFGNARRSLCALRLHRYARTRTHEKCSFHFRELRTRLHGSFPLPEADRQAAPRVSGTS